MRRTVHRSRRRIAAARLTGAAIGLITAAVVAGCGGASNDVDRGRVLFQQNCGTCHTLAQAGTSATVGPNLDAAFLQARAAGMDSDTVEGVVSAQIENPRYEEKGINNYDKVYMPAEIVTGQDAADVAAYVGSVAGVPGRSRHSCRPTSCSPQKCGICHTLAAAGTNATTGPNLDDVLAGKDAKFIEQQIIDPNSNIAQGFQPDIMPQDFGTTLSPKDVQGLVDYLLANVKGAKQ